MPHPAASTAIAWIDSPEARGCWGDPAALALPLDDRGLLLADGLFETLMVSDGRARLLTAHLARWRQGAALLGMEAPPTAAQLAPLIDEAVQRSGIRQGALRLNWSRGSAGKASRGIGIPERCRHRFWLQLSAATPGFEPVRVIVSPTEERSATSLPSLFTPFPLLPPSPPRPLPFPAGPFVSLLASCAGGLCCGTTANLLVRLEGRWLTPPLASGCLPGVMRARALELGLAQEAGLGALGEAALRHSSGALLLNSLSCRPISHLGETPLAWAGAPAGLGSASAEARALWQRLLEEGRD